MKKKKATFLLCGVKTNKGWQNFFFLLWTFDLCEAVFACVVYSSQRFLWILNPLPGELNLELIQTLLQSDDSLLCVSRFVQLGVTQPCCVVLLKICCVFFLFLQQLADNRNEVDAVSFPQFSISSSNCQGDRSFLTLPGKTLSQHSKNVLHCCFSPAFHFCSHVTIMLRVDVAMF